MKIITISGLDGSGKSTQIQLLKNHLEAQGKRVFYFHAIQFGIARKIVEFRNKYCLICRLLGKCKVKNNEEKSVTNASWLTIELRKIFLRIDIWRFNLLRSKLRNNGFDYILSDRYFFDSIINIEYLSSERDSVPNWGLSPLNHSTWTFRVQVPDLAICLKTSPEIIMSRQRVPDQGIEYLKKKKELYDNKITEWNMKVVEGNQDKDKVFSVILGIAKNL